MKIKEEIKRKEKKSLYIDIYIQTNTKHVEKEVRE